MKTWNLPEVIVSNGTIACINGLSADVVFHLVTEDAPDDLLGNFVADRAKVTWRHQNGLKTVKDANGKTKTTPILTVEEVYAKCVKVGDKYHLTVRLADLVSVRKPKVAETPESIAAKILGLSDKDIGILRDNEVLRNRLAARGITI